MVFIFNSIFKGEDVKKRVLSGWTPPISKEISWHLLHDVAVGSDGPCLGASHLRGRDGS